MNQTSTLFYLVNNFEEENDELIDLDDFLNLRPQEFEDVFKLLDTVRFQPKQEVVDKVIEYSKSIW